jgi:hypothetical protein
MWRVPSDGISPGLVQVRPPTKIANRSVWGFTVSV